MNIHNNKFLGTLSKVDFLGFQNADKNAIIESLLLAGRCTKLNPSLATQPVGTLGGSFTFGEYVADISIPHEPMPADIDETVIAEGNNKPGLSDEALRAASDRRQRSIEKEQTRIINERTQKYRDANDKKAQEFAEIDADTTTTPQQKSDSKDQYDALLARLQNQTQLTDEEETEIANKYPDEGKLTAREVRAIKSEHDSKCRNVELANKNKDFISTGIAESVKAVQKASRATADSFLTSPIVKQNNTMMSYFVDKYGLMDKNGNFSFDQLDIDGCRDIIMSSQVVAKNMHDQLEKFFPLVEEADFATFSLIYSELGYGNESKSPDFNPKNLTELLVLHSGLETYLARATEIEVKDAAGNVDKDASNEAREAIASLITKCIRFKEEKEAILDACSGYEEFLKSVFRRVDRVAREKVAAGHAEFASVAKNTETFLDTGLLQYFVPGRSAEFLSRDKLLKKLLVGADGENAAVEAFANVNMGEGRNNKLLNKLSINNDQDDQSRYVFELNGQKVPMKQNSFVSTDPSILFSPLTEIFDGGEDLDQNKKDLIDSTSLTEDSKHKKIPNTNLQTDSMQNYRRFKSESKGLFEPCTVNTEGFVTYKIRTMARSTIAQREAEYQTLKSQHRDTFLHAKNLSNWFAGACLVKTPGDYTEVKDDVSMDDAKNLLIKDSYDFIQTMCTKTEQSMQDSANKLHDMMDKADNNKMDPSVAIMSTGDAISQLERNIKGEGERIIESILSNPKDAAKNFKNVNLTGKHSINGFVGTPTLRTNYMFGDILATCLDSNTNNESSANTLGGLNIKKLKDGMFANVSTSKKRVDSDLVDSKISRSQLVPLLPIQTSSGGSLPQQPSSSKSKNEVDGRVATAVGLVTIALLGTVGYMVFKKRTSLNSSATISGTKKQDVKSTS